MNDQSQVMNQQTLPQPQMMTQQPLHPPPPVPSQNPPQMMAHHPPMMMNPPPMHGYGMWPPMNYQNPLNPSPQGGFIGSKPRNWKGKKGNDKRRMDNSKGNVLAGSGSTSNSGGGYRPPALNELQHQNRMKARRFFNPKKKYNNRFAPYAPRNTTSFLIRAKKSGGIASLVSPCPVTPSVLPTPIFSPSRETLGDMAKEEWGVDGYGSMKGLIRLRSPCGNHEGEDEEDGSSTDSDVEEHVEVERRLDHDLSRFEMIYPNYGGVDYNNALENRVDDQDTHIAHLEEENLILKERLFLMEREMGDLRRRMQYLERHNNHVADEINEEVVDNVSENDSESRDNGHSMDEHNEENGEEGEEVDGTEYGRDVCMDDFVDESHKDVNENQSKDEVSAGNQHKDDVSIENQSKDEREGNFCVEKIFETNNDIDFENVTKVQIGVDAKKNRVLECEK